MIKIYGIRNCSSVKKALNVLQSRKIDFEFLDIKKIDEDILTLWLKQRTFKELINSSGITARKLDLTKDKIQQLDENSLKKYVLENPSLIRRPVIELDCKIIIGKEYEDFFTK